ncbi:glycosyl hydrolase family 76-domain-containing protein [Entophlyctis helioformis]|nr:glycosyl hydrolase family 76-domain-containing protein [Entophlyctis helioformis]
MYGKDAVMPREAWQQWDTEACGGGIYWSRNRQAEDNRRTYKSTITNAQHMIMSGRLAILTGNSTFNERGELVYAWLKSSGLVTADWRVLDGGNAPTCRPPNPEELSYKIGTLLGGIGWLYKSTGKEQYQTEAASMLDVALRTFAPNNIFTDPCEAANPTCRANQVSPKGTMIRGLMYLYMTTTSAAIKTKIATAVETSFLAMAAAACDEKWNCGNVWQGAGARVYTDFHTQLNALELANALAIVRAPNGAPSGTQTAPSGTGNTGNTKGSAVAVGAGMTGVAGAVAAALMALLA